MMLDKPWNMGSKRVSHITKIKNGQKIIEKRVDTGKVGKQIEQSPLSIPHIVLSIAPSQLRYLVRQHNSSSS